MFTDTHCHVYEKDFNIANVIENAKLNQVNRFFVNGCDQETNEEILITIKKHKEIYGTLGIHPENVESYTEQNLNFIKEHLNDDKIIAIGEIGLDYYYTKENKQLQKELFEYQLGLAKKYNKPVIIHSREATQDTIDILKKYSLKGVIHSFSGSYETAEEYIKLGYKLGVNGIITFKNTNLRETLKKIDIKNIVIETDSPYLSPEPFRGTKNEPKNILLIANTLCDIYNINLKELASITNENISLIFDI